ncbi:UNVERIFIED_CONTAM: hypothetical protein K2H54_007971 [Gekko kuhli]
MWAGQVGETFLSTWTSPPLCSDLSQNIAAKQVWEGLLERQSERCTGEPRYCGGSKKITCFTLASKPARENNWCISALNVIIKKCHLKEAYSESHSGLSSEAFSPGKMSLLWDVKASNDPVNIERRESWDLSMSGLTLYFNPLLLQKGLR